MEQDTFSMLKISKPILSALEDSGFEKPTPIQKDSFDIIRSGSDVIGIAQTGTGKTIAYLIPLLMKLHYAQGNYPRAVIIVPTRELVVQICETVELLCPYMDIRCLGIYGGTNINTQQAKVYEGVDLLVASPGRFMDIYMNGILRTTKVKTIVVDEADRLMDLGFMPQLRAIMEVLPLKHQTLLFSATFSEAISELASEFLVNPSRIEVSPQATAVDNISQYKYFVPNIMTKINMLKVILSDKNIFSKVMIFTETKKNADRIIDTLENYWKEELSIIHSNKAQNTRLNALKAFKTGKSRILVSSDVAARGIDIELVTHVVNFDIPSLTEEYIHRIGRTGRAGNDGVAISLIGEKEIERFQNVEKLLGKEVEELDIPENVEISDLLMDEEKVQTANINYQRGRAKGGGAFHSKKKTPTQCSRKNKSCRKKKR